MLLQQIRFQHLDIYLQVDKVINYKLSEKI